MILPFLPLLLLVTYAQAVVVPRTMLSPFQDGTYADPPSRTTIAGPSCPISCSYAIQSATSYSWYKLKASTTVTHAIEYVIVNNRTNTTRTSTSYAELPGNITIPPTNSAGTQVWPMTISSPVAAGTWSTFVTNITYPQTFVQYPTGYTWWGALQTTTTDGVSVCSWAPYYWTGSNISTSAIWTKSLATSSVGCWGAAPTRQCATHTPTTSTWISTTGDWSRVASGQQVLFTSVPQIEPATTSVDPEDPKGYLYVIGLPSVQYGKGREVTPSPPGNNDVIWSQCTSADVPIPWIGLSSGVQPVQEMRSAYFLTVTSTIHENTGPTTTKALGQGLETLLAPTASSGSGVTVDAPRQTSVSPMATASSSYPVSVTVDGIAFSKPSITTVGTTAAVSFVFPSAVAGPSSPEDSDSVGIDMGFTKMTNSQPHTMGIDLGPSTAESAQTETPVGFSTGTPAAGPVSVSGEGFNIGFGPHTDGPTLVLTEIGGSLVLSTLSPSSTLATTASAEPAAPGTTKSAQSEPDDPTQISTAAEPANPGTTLGALEPDTPEPESSARTSLASEPGLPVIATVAPQEPGFTEVAASPTPIEVGGITVSQNSDTQLVVGSQTLAAGSSIIVGSGSSTTVVVLQTEGSSTHIVVGTATAAVPSLAPAKPVSSAAPAAPSRLAASPRPRTPHPRSSWALRPLPLALP
ncbi:hypothetical protein B0J12DRAFT_244648 [Macrophomina phaseolina]|uniref:Uncharacterized protein n=1 Tax=Macrophomina phaseolina TaxID=35725 RepID=A0ABQ8G0L5_9PEZI|nr:hypothetical protein B0J12DRAFT_244648 [Macrophomina phaseolina]